MGGETFLVHLPAQVIQERDLERNCPLFSPWSQPPSKGKSLPASWFFTASPELYSKHPFTHHLDSIIVNTWLSLLYHIFNHPSVYYILKNFQGSCKFHLCFIPDSQLAYYYSSIFVYFGGGGGNLHSERHILSVAFYRF